MCENAGKPAEDRAVSLDSGAWMMGSFKTLAINPTTPISLDTVWAWTESSQVQSSCCLYEGVENGGGGNLGDNKGQSQSEGTDCSFNLKEYRWLF